MVKPMITMLNHWFDWFNHWFNWFNHWLNYVNNIFSCIESTMMAQLGQGDPMAMKRERERGRERIGWSSYMDYRLGIKGFSWYKMSNI